MSQNPFRILSLNGGGVRALLQAYYLDLVSKESELNQFWRNFDLIIGTSAGAVVAAALCKGMQPSAIAQLISDRGECAFPQKYWVAIRRKLGVRYEGGYFPNDGLKKLLNDTFGKDTILGNFKNPMLAVTATNLTKSDVRVFTPIHDRPEDDKKDGDLNLVDVLMASTALPGVFDAYRVPGDGGEYLDGGMWANAPLLAGVALAVRNKSLTTQDMRIVGIGTGGEFYQSSAKKHNSIKPESVEFFEHLFNVAFSAAEHAAHEAVWRLVGEENVLYIDESPAEKIDAWSLKRAKRDLPTVAKKLADDSSVTDKLRQLIT